MQTNAKGAQKKKKRIGNCLQFRATCRTYLKLASGIKENYSHSKLERNL